MKKTAAAAAAVLMCLTLAGCGDDSSSDGDAKKADKSAEPTALTKAELIEQGDAICKESNDRIEAAAAPIGADPTEQQMIGFIADTLIPEIEGQAEGLRKLQPPADDAAAFDAILTALEKVFAVKFSVSEVEGLQNVGEMVDLIAKKLA